MAERGGGVRQADCGDGGGLSQRLHYHHVRHRHHTPEEGEEEEELDPRIQIELEKLNIASEEINRLEIQLDDARAAFRQVLSDSTQRLNGLAKKLGVCVEKARPYYDARMRLKEAHMDSQKAALRFERACSMHEAAKEMVQLAEEGYTRRDQDLSDPTWQEMLNHATMKVNDAERERMESESSHQQTTMAFKRRDEEVMRLQRDLKRMITKSRPYFEMKAKFNQVMEDHKQSVSQLEDDVSSAKSLYSQALRSLEAISDDIHRARVEKQQQRQLGERGAGVGAEVPEPPRLWGEKGADIEGSAQVVYQETDADAAQMNNSLKSDTGIVSHDHQYRRLASIKGKPGTPDTELLTDPLNLVVFKPSTDNPERITPPRCEDTAFQPPSVIRPDVDKSRSPSYRAAVEGSHRSGVDGGSGDSDNETFASRSGRLTSPGRVTSPDSTEDSLRESSLRRAAEWVERSPVPQPRGVTKSRSLVSQGGEMSPIVSAASVSVDLPDRSPVDVPDRLLVDSHREEWRSSSPATVDQSSPRSSGRSPKLQGLILRVDAVGDSSHTSGSTESPRIITAGQRPSVSVGFGDANSQSQLTVEGSNPIPPNSLMSRFKHSTTSTSSSHHESGRAHPRWSSPLSPPSPPGHLLSSGHHKLLSVPCSEHSSDTDSIASTGPMLDDDQVELLTLDFTESSITGGGEPAHSTSPQQRHRASLPPNLCHLEACLERLQGEGGYHLAATGTDQATQQSQAEFDGSNVNLNAKISLPQNSNNKVCETVEFSENNSSLESSDQHEQPSSTTVETSVTVIADHGRVEVDETAVAPLTQDCGESEVAALREDSVVEAPLACTEDLSPADPEEPVFV